MRKITNKEYKELPRTARGRRSPFMDSVVSLGTSEILFVSSQEWEEEGRSTSVPMLITSARHNPRSRLYRRNDIKVETVSNGWVIKRI